MSSVSRPCGDNIDLPRIKGNIAQPRTIPCYTAGVGEILVGTSGYSYDDWVGPVYPPGTARRDFLGRYAERFGFTELNFTYYREPTAEGLGQIAAKAPDSFRFVVKAHRSLTHERGAGWERAAERVLAALEGLATVSGRLLGMLLQFPYSFHYEQSNRRYLASLADALAPVRLFVEFRNNEWSRTSVWSELERRSVGLVVPDLPRMDRLPNITPRLTSPWGYVRLHGRNRANWWGGTNVTRYDYRYSTAELIEWVAPIRQLATQAQIVIVAFNNHFAGQAVENAEELMQLLGVAAS